MNQNVGWSKYQTSMSFQTSLDKSMVSVTPSSYMTWIKDKHFCFYRFIKRRWTTELSLSHTKCFLEHSSNSLMMPKHLKMSNTKLKRVREQQDTRLKRPSVSITNVSDWTFWLKRKIKFTSGLWNVPTWLPHQCSSGNIFSFGHECS